MVDGEDCNWKECPQSGTFKCMQLETWNGAGMEELGGVERSKPPNSGSATRGIEGGAQRGLSPFIIPRGQGKPPNRAPYAIVPSMYFPQWAPQR